MKGKGMGAQVSPLTPDLSKERIQVALANGLSDRKPFRLPPLNPFFKERKEAACFSFRTHRRKPISFIASIGAISITELVAMNVLSELSSPLLTSTIPMNLQSTSTYKHAHPLVFVHFNKRIN